MFALTSCIDSAEQRSQKAIDWLNTHPKPIRTLKHQMNGFTGDYSYTFVDANGTVFVAGTIVDATFPDTIKVAIQANTTNLK